MDRKFSFVIFGATGFAGQYVVSTMAETLFTAQKNHNWAIAGRNESKLKQTLYEVSQKTGKSIKDIPILICDTANTESLQQMTRQCKVVLNCVGPYRFFGEPVVKACVETGTNYVDISGEPHFIEKMEQVYNEKAQEKSCYIISACGFDSIPCDMGVQFTTKSFCGTLNEVECYHEVLAPKGVTANFTTFQCMIYGLANSNKLIELRKSISKNKPKIFKSKHELARRGIVFYNDDAKGWCVPFLGSDKSIVQRSQLYNFENNEERPIRIQTYLKTPGRFSAYLLIFWAMLFFVMTKFRFGRYLMETYPEWLTFGIFSKKGPTVDQIRSTSFITHLIGKGWLNKKLGKNEDLDLAPKDKIVCLVKGAEPGYVATSAFMVACALTIVEESDKLPKKGGVYTSASAFAKTGLINRLGRMGIDFEVK